MRPQPEDVLKLAERIVELKGYLASAQAEWDALFTSTISATPNPKVRSISEESGVGRILTLMNASPEKGFEAMALSRDLNIALATTRTSLSKLVSRGRIEKRGPGLYGAVTEKEKEVHEGTS
jgi:response regulator of citrate/malate metabolism